MKEGTDMKKWMVISSICLAASLIAACSNDTEKVSKEPAKTEAFTTESHKTNKTDQGAASSSKKPANHSTELTISGKKMTSIEKQKLIDFIAMYPFEHAQAVNSGNFTPLANEYIMHDTKLYENLLAEIPKKHKQGVQEELTKLEISSIKRDSDTDFTVDTKEIIAKTQKGKKDIKEYHRKYKVYYNYVKGNDAQSFFQISEITDIK